MSNIKRRITALEKRKSKEDQRSGVGQKYQRFDTWWDCLTTHWDYYADLVAQRPASHTWSKYGEDNLKRAPAGTIESDDKLELVFKALEHLRGFEGRADNDSQKVARILALETALHSHISTTYRHILFFAPPGDRINKLWLKDRADIIQPGQFCGPNKSRYAPIPEDNVTVKDYITRHWIAFEFEADRRRAIAAEGRNKYGYVQAHEQNRQWLERHDKYWVYRYRKFLNISKDSHDLTSI